MDTEKPLNLTVDLSQLDLDGFVPQGSLVVGNSGFIVDVIGSYFDYTPGGFTETPDSQDLQRQYAITFWGALGSFVEQVMSDERMLNLFTRPLIIHNVTHEDFCLFLQRGLNFNKRPKADQIVNFKPVQDEWGVYQVEINIDTLLKNFKLVEYLILMKSLAENSNYWV